MSLLITDIKKLCLVEDENRKWVSGADMAVLPSIENAWLQTKDGKIESYGAMDNCPVPVGETISVKGKMILPAWCDSHTHLVFADNRSGEFVDRIKGLSYEEIAAKGGGILNSARKLANTSEEVLLEQALVRADQIIRSGTGAVEIKSGYGLSLDAEMKMLRVAKKVGQMTKLTVKTTLLGAHAIPLEYKDRRKDYLDLVCNEMIPQAASEGLADFCDVFCEQGFFTEEEANRVLETGAKHGLRAKVHANQLHNSGGVQVGVKNNAISVDHLEEMGPDEIEALKGSETIATLLPTASFFLNMSFADGRALIDAGLPVALASDFNPGSTPTGNIPFVIALACIKCGMLPEEAINAATKNSAYAMGIEKDFGSISVGKWANFIVTKPMNSIAEIPYYFASDHIDSVYLKGEKQS